MEIFLKWCTNFSGFNNASNEKNISIDLIYLQVFQSFNWGSVNFIICTDCVKSVLYLNTLIHQKNIIFSFHNIYRFVNVYNFYLLSCFEILMAKIGGWKYISQEHEWNESDRNSNLACRFLVLFRCTSKCRTMNKI